MFGALQVVAQIYPASNLTLLSQGIFLGKFSGRIPPSRGWHTSRAGIRRNTLSRFKFSLSFLRETLSQKGANS